MDKWIKKKSHLFVAYKRLTSDLETYTDWKWRDKDVPCEEKPKISGVAILLSGKTKLKKKDCNKK